MSSNESISDTITAKSDQLNADDLIAGPITVTITGWKRGDTQEQPVRLEITGHHPYIPCKSMRRVLVAEWGDKPKDWIGRGLTLYREPSVMFGGVQVGGIRISHMSDMKDETTKFMLTVSRAKKSPHVVKRLMPHHQPAASAHEVTAKDLATLFARVGKHCSTNEEKEAIYRGLGVSGPIGKPTSWTRTYIEGGHQWCDQMETGN